MHESTRASPHTPASALVFHEFIEHHCKSISLPILFPFFLCSAAKNQLRVFLDEGFSRCYEALDLCLPKLDI